MNDASIERLKLSQYMESNVEAIMSFVSGQTGRFYYGKMGEL